MVVHLPQRHMVFPNDHLNGRRRWPPVSFPKELEDTDCQQDGPVMTERFEFLPLGPDALTRSRRVDGMGLDGYIK